MISAGKVCQTEQSISYGKGERSGIATATFAHRSIFYQKFHSRMAIAFTSRFSCSPSIQQRSVGRCECFSCYSVGNWSQLSRRQCLHIEYVKVNRMRAYYKSEEYDITEAAVDSLKSAEGSAEAVLVEGNLQETSPWWQQFPKRWVIVLLCFMAFLLCNMDRVSISFYEFFNVILVWVLSTSLVFLKYNQFSENNDAAAFIMGDSHSVICKISIKMQ